MTGEIWVQLLGLFLSSGMVALMASMNTKMKFVTKLLEDHEGRLRKLEGRQNGKA